MGNLDRGAPVDVKWLNDLNEKIDRLIAAANASPYQQATINTGLFDASGAKVLKTSETRIHAEAKSINQADYAVDSTVTFSIALNNFASAPVATVTPIVINPTSAKVAVQAVITSITTSAINGYLYFKTAVTANTTIGLSAIAIGVPSASGSTTNQRTNQFYTSPPQIG